MFGSLFLGRMIEEPEMQMPFKAEKKEYSIYGFGPVETKETQIGGKFYLPEVPLFLTVKGSCEIVGLDDAHLLITESVTDGETSRPFFRVLQVTGDAEIYSGSALVAKTVQGCWRVPTWSTGPESVKLSELFIHTRGELLTVSISIRSHFDGTVKLLRKFNVDLASIHVPGCLYVPAHHDVICSAVSPKNGGWASVSFKIE
jgi:hypothetical protein